MAGTGALGRLKDKVTASLAARRSAGRAEPRSSADGSDPGPDPGPDSGHDDAAGTGGITVAYAPEQDGDPDPGEVCWAWVAYEDDPSQGKDRPVLVIGTDGDLLAAVQLSSKDHSGRQDAQEWVAVGRGGWDRSGRESYADASRLLRLEPAAVRREGSALDRDRFDAVLTRVRTFHDWG